MGPPEPCVHRNCWRRCTRSPTAVDNVSNFFCNPHVRPWGLHAARDWRPRKGCKKRSKQYSVKLVRFGGSSLADGASTWGVRAWRRKDVVLPCWKGGAVLWKTSAGACCAEIRSGPATLHVDRRHGWQAAACSWSRRRGALVRGHSENDSAGVGDSDPAATDCGCFLRSRSQLLLELPCRGQSARRRRDGTARPAFSSFFFGLAL